MGVSSILLSNRKCIMTIKSYQMNSVLFFVQIILLSQLAISGYQCDEQGYKTFLTGDEIVSKKGFGFDTDGNSVGEWKPTTDEYEAYAMYFILNVDI